MQITTALLVTIATGTLAIQRSPAPHAADIGTMTSGAPILIPSPKAPTSDNLKKHGFRIPPGQANGVYIYDETTKEHTPIELIEDQSVSNSTKPQEADSAIIQNLYSAKFRRNTVPSNPTLPNPIYYCYQEVISPQNYASITSMFSKKCTGQQIPKGQSIYAFLNGFATAMCNTAEGSNPCSMSEFNGVMRDLSTYCGPNLNGFVKGGFEQTNTWGKGYGLYVPGMDLCGTSAVAPAR